MINGSLVDKIIFVFDEFNCRVESIKFFLRLKLSIENL